jgi:hypothetical protein
MSPRRPRAVLDTQLLIRAFHTGRGSTGGLVQALQQDRFHLASARLSSRAIGAALSIRATISTTYDAPTFTSSSRPSAALLNMSQARPSLLNMSLAPPSRGRCELKDSRDLRKSLMSFGTGLAIAGSVSETH